jgi:hypothetical protein
MLKTPNGKICLKCEEEKSLEFSMLKNDQKMGTSLDVKNAPTNKIMKPKEKTAKGTKAPIG